MSMAGYLFCNILSNKVIVQTRTLVPLFKEAIYLLNFVPGRLCRTLTCHTGDFTIFEGEIQIIFEMFNQQGEVC